MTIELVTVERKRYHSCARFATRVRCCDCMGLYNPLLDRSLVLAIYTTEVSRDWAGYQPNMRLDGVECVLPTSLDVNNTQLLSS
jgi:hypothetical protein